MVSTTPSPTHQSEIPAWLAILQEDAAAITTPEARKYWPGPDPAGPPYFNFRLEHIRQVERDAFRLLEELEPQDAFDRDIVLAGVWIHDRFKPQFGRRGDQHSLQAALWARENLAGSGFPIEKVECVAYAVEHHSDPPGQIAAGYPEARLLWDADKLTKFGTLNIVSYLTGNPCFPQNPVSFTSIALRGLARLEQDDRLADEFYTVPARRIARERFEQQKAFYTAFAKDVQI